MTFLFTTPYSVQIGVAGAGTMGSGIALAALYAGLPVILYDLSPEMLENARGYIESNLERKGLQAERRNLQITGELEDLRTAGIVIEAIPESLALKQALFARLDELCPAPAILATNTSTLAITAIAAATRSPDRVAGLHFFNPAPVLPLVEIIYGSRTSSETAAALARFAERLGKTAVMARDLPGFIVNRVARPFYGEALRLVGEGAATLEQVDRAARLGGGFRMGPFQLMDLIGIDVNLAAMQSMYDQSFGEPRYRPHPLQVQKVQEHALGRKTGRGFYTYEPLPPPEDPAPPAAARATGRVYLSPGAWGPGIGEAFRTIGYTLSSMLSEATVPPRLAILRLGKNEGLRRALAQAETYLSPETPILCQCADVTLTEICTWSRQPERLAGFDGLFFTHGPLGTLVPSPTLTPQARASMDAFVVTSGRLPLWIQDSPGLILPRLICMLANEAAFAVQDGVAEAEKIDLAMRLGVNYPKGPLAWAKSIGYALVVGVMDHLYAEYHEERYRAAPLLRRWARLEQISA